MSGTLISVIVPAYNAARFLPEAIASIRAQNWEPLEILLVDDGSTDETATVAAALEGVRVFRKPNGGAASARNFGLKEARGEWISFLDADDLWPPDKLSCLGPRLEADPSLDVVTGRIQYVPMDGALWLDYRFERPDNTVSHIHLGAALYRRRAFERIGGFDESLRVGDDQDWFLRAREAGLGILIVGDITLHYRLHDSNMTRGATAQAFEFTEVLRRSLQRRRARGGPASELPAWSSFDETRRRNE
ncbi:MAG: glycosyltransferase family A protein [Bryobacteraceae bacterium]